MAYAGHGCSDARGTFAKLDSAARNVFPLEGMLANLGKRDDVYVLAPLNCCRTPLKTDGDSDDDEGGSEFKGLITYAC